MILECAECHTRYLVPEAAIGSEGRTVRCASCKHSWFQAPRPLDLATPAPAVAAAIAAPESEPAPAAPRPVYRSYEDDGTRVRSANDAGWSEPVRPRRNPARRWTMAAFAAGVAMLAGTAAILYTGAPGLATQIGLFKQIETPLRFTDKAIDRRDLANGSELFAVSGHVVNPSNASQRVPDIRAELTDGDGKLVYSWTIVPARRFLAPGGRIDFDSAKLDVPENSKMLELSFAGEK